MWLHGSRVQFDPDTPIKLQKATKAGYLLRKPQLDSLAVGDLVAQRTISNGTSKWRVMAFQGDMVELRRADRKQPDFAMVTRSQLIYTIADKIPLYHPDGIGLDYDAGASLLCAQALPSSSSLHKAGSQELCCQKSAGDYMA